jgi:hypothetical protein
MSDLIQHLKDSGAGEPKTVQCPVTGEIINRDDSHRIGVGFSHYKLDESGSLIRSYNQVFNTQHCANRDAAKSAARMRIAKHADIPFGEYKPEIHNPDESHIDHATAESLVEYNEDGIVPKDKLPKKCAVTGQPLTNEWYIPHVDDSTRGAHYQSILQKQFPRATIEELTLAANSLENAQKLAHQIIDEILEPDYQKSLKEVK